MESSFKPKKITINFFLQSKDFGGAEQFAKDLLLELAKKGNFVYLYTSNDFLLKNLTNKKNLQVKKTPLYLDFASNRRGLLKSILLSPFAIIYYFKVFSEIKKRSSKQVVIYSGFSEKIIPGPLSKLFNLPTFFIEYGPLEPLFVKLRGIPKFLYFLTKNIASKIIVPSNNTQFALKKVFAKEKMIIIPCGSSIPSLKRKKTIKKRTITVISRLEKGKGQDLAIKAFALVKKEFKDAELLIIGQGNFEKELKLMAKNDQQIKFLQYVRNKQKAIEESELIVCPSVWSLEGFGLTIIEAMAFAKPIVAFDRAPGNEILNNEKNSLLAKNKDYIDLSNKIIELLKDKNLQKKLAKNAQQNFIEKYQIEKVAEQYLNLLKN